jgi:hypothetical protein
MREAEIDAIGEDDREQRIAIVGFRPERRWMKHSLNPVQASTSSRRSVIFTRGSRS